MKSVSLTQEVINKLKELYEVHKHCGGHIVDYKDKNGKYSWNVNTGAVWFEDEENLVHIGIIGL